MWAPSAPADPHRARRFGYAARRAVALGPVLFLLCQAAVGCQASSARPAGDSTERGSSSHRHLPSPLRVASSEVTAVDRKWVRVVVADGMSEASLAPVQSGLAGDRSTPTLREVARWARYAAAARRAALAGLGPLGHRQVRVLVELVPSAARLETRLDAPPGSYSGIAAVTARTAPQSEGSKPGSAWTGRQFPRHSPQQSLGTQGARQVYVNLSVAGDYGPRAQQVLLTHEFVHLLGGHSRARPADLPMWFDEGFADYVALHRLRRRLGEDRRVASLAPALRHWLSRGRPLPQDFPSQAAFRAGSPHLQATYEASWLACEVIERSGGAGTLLDVRAGLQRRLTLDQALHVAGLRSSEVRREWRLQLADLR